VGIRLFADLIIFLSLRKYFVLFISVSKWPCSISVWKKSSTKRAWKQSCTAECD